MRAGAGSTAVNYEQVQPYMGCTVSGLEADADCLSLRSSMARSSLTTRSPLEPFLWKYGTM